MLCPHENPGLTPHMSPFGDSDRYDKVVVEKGRRGQNCINPFRFRDLKKFFKFRP